MNIIVLVIRREIFGLVGFHAKCQRCGWTSRGTEREALALRWAKGHGKRCLPNV